MSGVYPVTAVRLPPTPGAELDKWADSQADAPTGSEAIRRLVEIGLKAKEMTKTPGEFQPTKPINKAEREARKAFRQVDAEKAMTELEVAQRAFSANRERLKAERLAREAADTPITAKKAKLRKKSK